MESRAVPDTNSALDRRLVADKRNSGKAHHHIGSEEGPVFLRTAHLC
jgi:hypothetical protein